MVGSGLDVEPAFDHAPRGRHADRTGRDGVAARAGLGRVATSRAPAMARAGHGTAAGRDHGRRQLPARVGADRQPAAAALQRLVPLVILPAAGLHRFALGDTRTRALALVASSGLVLALLPLQYARYLQPSLALLLPALVVAYPMIRHGAVAFWSLCVLNLAFATNANWMLRTGALKRDIANPTSDDTLFLRYAPERLLVERLPQDEAVVLVMPGNYGALAELGQRGRNMSWYSPAWEAEFARVESDPSGQAWASLLQRERIGHVLLDDRKASAALRAGLAIAGAREVDAAGNSQRWSLPMERSR